jgi:prepilin-type N-terminal cleavage/methylation domain-containing protein
VNKLTNYRERGASLVELVVTMALMSILASAFATAIKDRASTSRLEGDSRDIYTELQLARQLAVTEGKKCRVSFNRDAGTYTVWIDYNDNNAPDDPVAPGQPVEVKASGTLQEDISFGFQAGVTAAPQANNVGPIADGSFADGLSFDPRGWCHDLPGGTPPETNGSPGEIYLYRSPPVGGDASDWQMTGITIRSATGRPRLWHLQKGTTDEWS